MHSLFTPRFFFTLAVFTLTGCGGGGGNGSGTNSGGNTAEPQNPVTQTPAQLKQNYTNYTNSLYIGETEQATLSTELVQRVASNALGEHRWHPPYLGAEVWDSVSFESTSTKGGIPEANFKSARAAQQKIFNDNLICEGGGEALLSGEVNDNGIGNIEVNFTDCDNSYGESLNGIAIISFEETSDTNNIYGVFFHDLVVTYLRESSSTPPPTTITGFWRVSVSAQRFFAEDHLLFTPQADTLQYMQSQTYSETDFATEVSARAYIHDAGFIELESNTSLWAFYSYNPSGAFVTFSGSNDFKAALDFSDSEIPRYIVDDDNDGEYDRGTYFSSLESFLAETEINITLVALDELNIPPTVYAPYVSNYPAPTTNDDITVEAPSVYDDDTPSDELSITYEWRINGNIVEDVNGATLPAGRAAFGDTVTVAAIVFDGFSTVTSDTRSITIADSPSIAIVSDYPASIAPGEKLSFTVSYTDPDAPNSTFNAALAYGPNAMTISDEGQVQWQAITPLFGSAVVSFGIRDAREPEGDITELSVNIEAPDTQLPIARNGILRATHPQSMLIGDFTGDSSQEIAIIDNGHRLQIIAFENDRYQELWSYPYQLNTDYNVKLEAVQFDEDAREEILIVASKAVYLLDDISSRPQQLYETSGRIYSAQIIDSDNDNILELAILEASSTYSDSEKTLRVIELAEARSELFSTTLGSLTNRLIAGNVDDDAAIELVTNDGFVYDTTTWTNEWYYSAGFGRNNFALGDLDNNGIAEIVGSNSSNELSIYSALNKSIVGTAGAINSCGYFLHNIDADAADELINAPCAYDDVELRAYDLIDETLTEAWFFDPIDYTTLDLDSFVVGDADGDGSAEVIITDLRSRYGSSIGFFSVVSTESDATDFEYQSASTDHLGFSQAIGWAQVTPENERAVFVTHDINNSYGGQHLVLMDENGSFTLTEEISESDGTSAALNDFNNDGNADIFLATNASFYGDDLSVLQIDDLTEHWNSGELTNGVSMISAVDVNGDGSEDAVFVDGGDIVRIIDVSNEALLDSFTTTQHIADIAILQSTNSLVIATCSYSGVSIWRKVNTTYTAVANVAEECDHIAFGNIDDDTLLELVVVDADTRYQSRVISYDFENDQLREISDVNFPALIDDLVFDTSRTNNQTLLASIRGYLPISNEGYASIVSLSPTSETIIWSSPMLPSYVRKNSMVFRDDPDAPHRLMFSTWSTLYLVE